MKTVGELTGLRGDYARGLVSANTSMKLTAVSPVLAARRSLGLAGAGIADPVARFLETSTVLDRSFRTLTKPVDDLVAMTVRPLQDSLAKSLREDDSDTAVNDEEPPAARPAEGFATMDDRALAKEFRGSILRCLANRARLQRWRTALTTLEADPVFERAGVSDLANYASEAEAAPTRSPETGQDEEEAVGQGGLNAHARHLWENFSSGHKIVLLTLTRLVETVSEQSLVLIDEPEAHLHPPLLSAFVRALSDLLVDRNAIALIATHSPVVLQEVPRSCVSKLRREGAEVAVEPPAIETFGENVGVLTREVFGLEVTRSGFHLLLSQAVDRGLSYGQILQRFHDQLGGEARALVRGLIATRDLPEDF